MQLPTVSIIIPTLNSARTLEACLRAVRAQDYPAQRLEIVAADAGSTDTTLELLKRYHVERQVDNPLRTGEAGKAAGIAAASGELLALIDSDNILPDSGWLRRMVAPLMSCPELLGSEPLQYISRPEDAPLTRYFSLLGMTDPLCLFTGNYDRLCQITGRWTDLPVESEDRGDYLALRLSPEALPTLGANGNLLRRQCLEGLDWHPWYFDIDVIYQAVLAGHRDYAKVKCGIIHEYCADLRLFAVKQRRRIHDYLYFSGQGRRAYPWDKLRRRGVARFCAATLLVAPLLHQAARGQRRSPDRAAWRYHLPVCWRTLAVYGVATLRHAAGLPPPAPKRQGWQTR